MISNIKNTATYTRDQNMHRTKDNHQKANINEKSTQAASSSDKTTKIIEKLNQGEALSEDDLRYLADGYNSNIITNEELLQNIVDKSNEKFESDCKMSIILSKMNSNKKLSPEELEHLRKTNQNPVQLLVDRVKLKDNEKKQPDYRLSGIIGRLNQGEKLSPMDIEYLRVKSPELYKKALKIKEKRDEFERKLRACKSKAEVRDIHQSVTQATFISDVDTGDASVAKTGGDTMLSMALGKEWGTFTRSNRYEKLQEHRLNKRKIDVLV